MLVDADYIDRPDRLEGLTNPVMARLAGRLGFKPMNKVGDMIGAEYSDVQERLFSPDMLRLEETLGQRMERVATGAGHVAISENKLALR